MVNKKLKLS